MVETVKAHIFKMDIESTRQACICGKAFLDPIHTVNVRIVRGTATPTTIKR